MAEGKTARDKSPGEDFVLTLVVNRFYIVLLAVGTFLFIQALVGISVSGPASSHATVEDDGDWGQSDASTVPVASTEKKNHIHAASGLPELGKQEGNGLELKKKEFGGALSHVTREGSDSVDLTIKWTGEGAGETSGIDSKRTAIRGQADGKKAHGLRISKTRLSLSKTRGGCKGRKLHTASGNVTRQTVRPCQGISTETPRLAWQLNPKDKFLWYSAHSGFGNQLIQFRWALRIAALLNRTLIIPPKLGHFASRNGLGRCDGIANPAELVRWAASGIYVKLLASPDYVSLADVLDVSGLPRSIVKTIDFRHFVSHYCNCNVGVTCAGPWCFHMNNHHSSKVSQLKRCLKICLNRMGGHYSSRFDKKFKVHRVNQLCNDTIWTVGSYSSFEELMVALEGRNGHVAAFAHARYRAGLPGPKPVNLKAALGAEGSRPQQAKVLAFGSTFHPRIADISNLPPGKTSDSILAMQQATEVFPFTPHILQAARQFVKQHIGPTFACLHLRAGDGFFKRSYQHTSRQAKRKLELLHTKVCADRGWDPGNGTVAEKLPLFVMTDLKMELWGDTVLGDLDEMGFEVHTSAAFTREIEIAGKLTLAGEYGLFANRFPRGAATGSPDAAYHSMASKDLPRRLARKPVKDTLLMVEQIICSCNKLGFVRSLRSTASGHIRSLQRLQLCKSE